MTTKTAANTCKYIYVTPVVFNGQVMTIKEVSQHTLEKGNVAAKSSVSVLGVTDASLS